MCTQSIGASWMPVYPCSANLDKRNGDLWNCGSRTRTRFLSLWSKYPTTIRSGETNAAFPRSKSELLSGAAPALTLGSGSIPLFAP
jgi:hypothetical protein